MHRVIVPALAELGDEHVRRGQARQSKGHTENGIRGQQPIERRPLVVLLLLLLVVTTHAVVGLDYGSSIQSTAHISTSTTKSEERSCAEEVRQIISGSFPLKRAVFGQSGRYVLGCV